MGAGIIAVGVPLSVGATVDSFLTRYCVLDDRITFQDGLLSDEVAHAWTDIRAIAVSCSRGRGKQARRSTVVLTMSDGFQIDIAQAVGPFWGNIGRVGKDLRHARFAYDTSGIQSGCTNERYLSLGPRYWY
jgi:hypothetical protein